MKSFFFAVLVLSFSSSAFSQMTLNGSYNPVAGNGFLEVNCDTNGISEGNSGANQNWNFSNLVRLDSVNINWVNSGTTPYAANFPTSNIAEADEQDYYTYFTTSNSEMLYNGSAGTDLQIVYNNPQVLIQFPFTYTNSFTDDFSSDYTAAGVSINRIGTTTANCDAWGTIVLPNGTFNNAIRIKYQDSFRDSSFIGISFVTEFNFIYYVWYVPDVKFPVLEIRYTNVIINGITQNNSKFVFYKPNNPSIGISQISSIVADDYKLYQNYPNPFNPSTKIKFDVSNGNRTNMSKVNLVVYDELGKEVAVLVNENLSPGSYEADWNASDIAGGVYYYKLTVGNFSETRKMILVK